MTHNDEPNLESDVSAEAGLQLYAAGEQADSGVHVSKIRRAAEATILFAEITPLNEAMRVTAGGAAIAAGADPLLAAGIFAGTNMVIESAAAVAAASWLGTERSKKTMDWFNGKLSKVGISPEAKFSPLAKGGIAYLGGSAISAAVKYREDTSLEEKEIRRYGLQVATALSGVVAVQGFLIAEGIESPSPLTIGGALLAVASVGGIFKWAKRRIRSEEKEQGIVLQPVTES